MSRLDSVAETPPVPARLRRPFWNTFAAVVRWLHIYVSLLGFTTLIFFAVTGITLNHPVWFGADQQQTVELTGELPVAWLQPESLGDAAAPAAAERSEVDKLAVVERLRATHGLRGGVGEFRVDEQECMLLFKGPSYAADVYIDRAAGTYTGTVTTMGSVAFLNDLHKGRDTGFAWSLVIDLSALVTIFVSITGLVLIFFLKRRRWSGLLTAVAGTFLLIAAAWCMI